MKDFVKEQDDLFWQYIKAESAAWLVEAHFTAKRQRV